MIYPEQSFFSDAGIFAIGEFENEPGTHTCHKNLITKQRLESSTWREL